MMTWRFDQLSALHARMARLDGAALLEAAAPAVARGLADMEATAKALCPRDTGELAGSIRAAAEGASGTLRAQAPHAAAVEMGTWRMAARPFLYPAYAAHAQQIVQDVARAALLRAGGGEA